MLLDERAAYLLEMHEYSHHALLFSTPAGVLLWRLNQSIARDITYVFRKARDLGVEFPATKSPASLLNSVAWQRSFATRHDLPELERVNFLYFVGALNDLVRLRSIFFGRDGATTNSELTFGELLELLTRSYAYLEERCELKFAAQWRTNLPLTTKVFGDGVKFNVHDIAEAHAIAGELFTLRALGDITSFDERRAKARAGPFGTAFTVGEAETKSVNSLGFSPHQVQVMALVACSSCLDVCDADDELLLEDTLPWWKFTAASVREPHLFGDALMNCYTLAGSSLVGAGSRWLVLEDVDLSQQPRTKEEQAEQASSLAKTLGSFSLDLQLKAFHVNLKLNARYLWTEMKKSLSDLPDSPLEPISGEDWRAQLLLAVPLIEYSDAMLFQSENLDSAYAASHPLRSFHLYGDLRHPGFQLLAHLINGSTHRSLFAAYAGHLVPNTSVLKPKLTKLFGVAFASFAATLLEAMFDKGFAVNVDTVHLNVVPGYVPSTHYI